MLSMDTEANPGPASMEPSPDGSSASVESAAAGLVSIAEQSPSPQPVASVKPK